MFLKKKKKTLSKKVPTEIWQLKVEPGMVVHTYSPSTRG
jgi:hypothetical protein